MGSRYAEATNSTANAAGRHSPALRRNGRKATARTTARLAKIPAVQSHCTIGQGSAASGAASSAAMGG